MDASPWGARAEEWHLTDGREVALRSAEMLKSFVDEESLKAWIKWNVSAPAFCQPVPESRGDEGRKMLFKVYEDLKKRTQTISFFKVQVVKKW